MLFRTGTLPGTAVVHYSLVRTMRRLEALCARFNAQTMLGGVCSSVVRSSPSDVVVVVFLLKLVETAYIFFFFLFNPPADGAK